MKASNIAKFVTGIWLGFTISVNAQTFMSGSDGSYGPIDVPASTTVTLAVPPDGIFHCTTITVQGNGTLRFSRNALNTPVYLLATSNVVINGLIDVSGSSGPGNIPGQGGPGGFEGGYGPSGDGHGPGGGRNQTGYYNAAYAFPAGSNTSTYGNILLTPLIG